VFDDPKMGWSRWAHSFHIFTLNSGEVTLIGHSHSYRPLSLSEHLHRWIKVTLTEEARYAAVPYCHTYSDSGPLQVSRADVQRQPP
jgi:hypothetical protein